MSAVGNPGKHRFVYHTSLYQHQTAGRSGFKLCAPAVHCAYTHFEFRGRSVRCSHRVCVLLLNLCYLSLSLSLFCSTLGGRSLASASTWLHVYVYVCLPKGKRARELIFELGFWFRAKWWDDCRESRKWEVRESMKLKLLWTERWRFYFTYRTNNSHGLSEKVNSFFYKIPNP